MNNNKTIMEYKINEYNITDIKYKDLKGLISCFESSIPLSKISLCNFGPNIMHVKSTESKFPKTKEDRKILKSQSNLILSSLNQKEKNEESNFCFSMSNNINKIYLKRFLYQMNLILQAKNKNKVNNLDENNNKGDKQDIKELMNFFNLISYFTCIKDEYGDEIPITDYSLSISVDKSIKYNKLNLIQFNYEYITQNIIKSFETNSDLDNDPSINKNNIHIFYMLIYNLPVNELYNFLYCEETKDYFSIFSEEETLDEITKRFIFINQFKLLKNDISFRVMTINNDNGDETENNNNENIRYNFNAIKNEYNYYSTLYNNYLIIKENFLISDEDEKKIFGNYFSILLLSEFDFIHDELIINIINKNYRELRYNDDKSVTNIFSILRNILVNDLRFSFLASNKNQIDRKRYPYLLSKISYCLGIPEDKIIYILLTENNNSDNENKENIVTDEIIIFKNIINLINILYLKSIDNLMEIFASYNKKKKLTFSNGIIKPRKSLNIFLMRSNLVYNITYEKYLFSNNSFLAVGDNFIDSNSFIISYNIKEHLYSNYIQEKKNFIYLKNSLSMNFDKNFPKIFENSEYLNSIFRESLNFEEILNVYENEICGLLKLINYNNSSNNTHNFNIFDSKNNFNINHFKVQFNKNISRKNKIEIIDVFNSVNQKNEIFMKVTHTFGVFLYDLNKLFSIDNSNNTNLTNRSNMATELNVAPNIYKEQMINKLLEYKPYNYNSSSIKYLQENTTKIINSLSLSKKPLYISCLLELNKFNTLTLFDDMKINIIYVYYSNYYNYILNINDIRQYLLQNYNNVIPKNMRNKDNFTLFKFLSRKIRITANDYITDKFYKNKENNNKFRNRDYNNNFIDFIFVKNKLSNLFGNERNISLMLYKYNYRQYLQLFCDKLSKSKFNYFIYAINGVKAFVKLTKIYKEKSVLSNVRNLITDIIVDNYDLIKEDEMKNIKKNEPIFNSLSPINQKLLSKIDNLEELVFDFNKEALGKMLPKLRSNLVQLKRMWQDYIYDIIYLINNANIFYNKECTELVIEQRLLNFQILLFLFHKNYKFINSESVKKYGSILVMEFTKTVSIEVLRLLEELRKDFDIFLSENNKINKNLNEFKKNFENITFEKLILKRIELQNIINLKIKEKENNFIKINQQKMREKNLENKNWSSNGGEGGPLPEKIKKYKYNNDMRGNDISKNKNHKNLKDNNNNSINSENKFKEFTISQKDLNEGRLDNSLRMSKSRKPSSRAIESFNTVNRNSQLQLTINKTSGNNSPKTQDNRNFSDYEDISNERYRNNNNYEYKFDNVSFRNIDESTNKGIKAKIVYTNKQNDNYEENNDTNRLNKNNNDDNNIVVYNRKKDSKNKNNSNNNSYSNNRNDMNNNSPNKSYVNIDQNCKNPENDELNNNRYQNSYRNNPNQQYNRNENYTDNNRNDGNYDRNNSNQNNNMNRNNNINKTDNNQNNNMNRNNNINNRDNSQNNNNQNNNMNRNNNINNRDNNQNNNNKNNNYDRNINLNGVNNSPDNYIKNRNDNMREIHSKFINKDKNSNPGNNRDNNISNQNRPNIINISNNNSNDNNENIPNNYSNRNGEKENANNLNDNPNDRNNMIKNNIIIPNEYDNDNNNENNNNNYRNRNNDNSKNNNSYPNKNINDQNNNENPNNNNNDNNLRNNKSKYKNSFVIESSNSKNKDKNSGNKNNNNDMNNNIPRYNNNNNINNDLNENPDDNVNDSPSFSKSNPKEFDPKNGIVLDKNNYSFQIDNKNQTPKKNNRNNNQNNEDNDNNMENENQVDNNNYNKNKMLNDNKYRNLNNKNNNDNSNENTMPKNSKTNSKRNFNNNERDPNNPKNSNTNSKRDLIPNNSKNSSNKNFNKNNNSNPSNSRTNSKNNSNKNFNNKPNNSKNNSYKNFNDNRNNDGNNDIDEEDNENNNNNGNNNINDNDMDDENNNGNQNENENENENDNDDNYISFKDNNIRNKNNNKNKKAKPKNKNNNNNNDGNDNNNDNDNNYEEEEEDYNEEEDNNDNNNRNSNRNNNRNNNNKNNNQNNNQKQNSKKPKKNKRQKNDEYDENEENEENPDINNQDEDNQNGENEEDLEKYYISWLPDEELQKIYQTLSDVNDVEIEKTVPKNYMTYPFEEKKDNLKITKDLPEKIKKRLNLYIVKLMKENEIKKISSDENINILYLQELEKRIKQARKEANSIDINDGIFEKIEELHFNDEDFDENNLVDYKLYNMAEELNKEFYDNVEAKLQMTEEAINNLNQ